MLNNAVGCWFVVLDLVHESMFISQPIDVFLDSIDSYP